MKTTKCREMPLTLNEWKQEVHDLAVKKGWWTDTKTGEPVDPESKIPEAIALIHSELSEALTEFRNNKPHVLRIENGKPEGLSVELADAVLRIFDLCGALDIDLEAVLAIKHQYNKTRPYRHGNKRI